MEIERVKQSCYKKIEIIQSKTKLNSADNIEQGTDAEKIWLKNKIAEALAEISDVSDYSQEKESISTFENSQKSIEINLLVSQIVCEISKLYEKQIVLEKQKAS